MLIESQYFKRVDTQIITIEQYKKRREQRRRRVAKRMLKRFPLFAIEEMRAEFPFYDMNTFIADVTRKTRKSKSFRNPKSPCTQMGRYMEMEKKLSDYHRTKDIRFLQKAQKLRDNLFKPYRIIFKLNGKPVLEQTLPPTMDFNSVKQLSEIKFSSLDELNFILDEKLKFCSK